MNIKECAKPLQLLKLEALDKRIPIEHVKHKIIIGSLVRYRAGFKGEQSINYYLSLLPPEHYLFFHNVRLYDGSHYFQIDTLILTKHYLLILEVKNIAGTIVFNHVTKQLVRMINEKEEAFKYPIIQNEAQLAHMKKWLKLHKLPSIPVEGLVVIANENTVIKTSDQSPHFSDEVVPSPALPDQIRKLDKKYQSVKKSKKVLEKLSQKILAQNSELDQNILNQFEITKEDLITGVQCQGCTNYSMVRIDRMWKCSHCEIQSKDAHVSALLDYSLLISPTISNREARQFLQISSPDIAKRILSKYPVAESGRTCNRRYILRPHI
ncbi:nuclease-related domain-containing protein [Alkalihalobacillus sp. AL-G]|uniref:nuclease-related domain-containing protein n=1 Tax=Alkalihalobacillus sp. AL-G TaxID=2926399 RepID=UPI00272C0BA1|nr:nuclease-related domain-containing protein [Alkalihalobacillus sp. AL-G]WLD94675.1 NERD domain-containing protein [Alkalihalobacillus sp. AL-G]